MRKTLYRLAVDAAFVVSLSATLAACSGGGGGDDPIPAGTCRRAAISATGPGDTWNYFPAEVGRSWTYRNESGTTGTTTVSGTQVVGGELAAVFTTTTSYDPTPATELVVKRPSGVYVLSDPSAEPPFDQLYPSLVLPFPVAVTAPTEQATCRALDLGDLDGDGKADHADVVVSLRVFSVVETADVVGHFSDVAHAQMLAHVTATASSQGTVVVDATRDDWYARDVGRLLSLLTFTSAGRVERSTTSLQSWTGPAAVQVAAGQALMPMTSPPSLAPGLEQAALQLARKAIGAAR